MENWLVFFLNFEFLPDSSDRLNLVLYCSVMKSNDSKATAGNGVRGGGRAIRTKGFTRTEDRPRREVKEPCGGSFSRPDKWFGKTRRIADDDDAFMAVVCASPGTGGVSEAELPVPEIQHCAMRIIEIHPMADKSGSGAREIGQVHRDHWYRDEHRDEVPGDVHRHFVRRPIGRVGAGFGGLHDETEFSIAKLIRRRE